MNRLQDARLASINDQWGASRWEMVGAEVRVECDDGDEAIIHVDGTATWLSTTSPVEPKAL